LALGKEEEKVTERQSNRTNRTEPDEDNGRDRDHDHDDVTFLSGRD
jgi:hypothetical protein